MRSLRTAPKTVLGQLLVVVSKHDERSALRRLLNAISLRPTERRVLLGALMRNDPVLTDRVAGYERAARRALASSRTSIEGRGLAQAVLELLGRAE